jgi:hypothetical protein
MKRFRILNFRNGDQEYVVFVEQDDDTPTADYAKPGFTLRSDIHVVAMKGDPITLPMQSEMVKEG